MALFAKQFSLLLLFISLSSSHARESQFFNKIPATTTNDDVSYNKKPEPYQPIPQKYDQAFYTLEPEASDNKRPEPNQPLPRKYDQASYTPEPDFSYNKKPESYQPIPRKYDQASYTSEPDFSYNKKPESYQPIPRKYDQASYTPQPNKLNDNNDIFSDDRKSLAAAKSGDKNDGGAGSYFITPEEKDPEYNKNYYNEGSSSSFNSVGKADFGRGEKSLNNVGGAEAKRNQPQGMSDTRSMENGKYGQYYYDIEAAKYNSNYLYDSQKKSGERNGYGVNGEKRYEFNGVKNSIGGYQNQRYDFQDDEYNNWRN